MKLNALALLAACLFATQAFGQSSSPYNDCKGKNRVTEEARDSEGLIQKDKAGRPLRREVAPDRFGNAQGSQYDLARDGAFEGQTVAVIQLAAEIDFSRPRAALKQKGFSVYRWLGAPDADELRTKLAKACQLWILSGTAQQLGPKHLEVIKEFYESGRGLYIWGDNNP